MQLSDKIKKFSVEQAIDYLNRNPVKNLPKLLDRADTFCAGKFEGQRRAIRKACLDPTDAHYPSVNWDAISSEEYFRQLIDLGCLFIWYFHYMPVGSDASPGRQPPQPRRSKERAQKADTRKNAKKQRFPFGKRCFSSLLLKQKAWGARQTRGTPPAALEKTTHSIQQKAPPPGRETVLLHARRCYDPLPDDCAGAVTSVRVTPLEKVRLLRMAEKSLDMLR